MGGFYEKSWLIRALLLTAYCVPFAFFSVKGDITSGTMVYYGVMIVSFVILYRCALKTDNVPIIFIGNILSFISSYLTAKLSQLDPMGWYCKPFTSHSLIVAISVASSSSMRSSYGEEAESRGTHRGVTEHEETQKAMIALLIVALFGMILACISSHPFVSRRCEVPEEYVAEIRAQSVGVYSKKVPLLPIYISIEQFSADGPIIRFTISRLERLACPIV